MEGVTFRDLLREARARAALSQRELAEAAGISERAVSDLERGKRRKPSPSTVRQLAESLGLEGERFADFACASREDRERVRR